MKKIVILLLIWCTFVLGGQRIIYSLDFSKQKDGDATAWLHAKGFQFLLDSKALHLRFEQGSLVFDTTHEKAGLFGLRFKNGIPNIGIVEIEWGAKRFPQGANWSEGNNRVAVGAIFVMGTEKFRAGVPFVKAVPYFLCPFIGEKETVGKSYKGALYKKSGRYYCVANKTGFHKTRFNLDQKFKNTFKKETPALTAFAFQMNTKNTQGRAKAFIKKITFYSK